MKVSYTPEDLVAFEDRIAYLFAAKRIYAPVHLAGGNEEQLIRIFREHVNPEDWVLGSWRSHYHCLLKGVPPAELEQAILAGKSISLCFPEYRILSSGIVGGTAPIAVGLAMGIKRKREGRGPTEPPRIGEMEDAYTRKVVCFLGDMTAESGIVYESIKYAANFDLPVLFVVEDNGLSVVTDSAKVWGFKKPPSSEWSGPKIIGYHYKLTRPHVGIGKFVEF